ncbi:hypothetical protein [Arthrobacter sp.]
MTAIGRALIVATVVMVIVAIWTPYHWQAGLTALVTLIAGAAILGQGDTK